MDILAYVRGALSLLAVIAIELTIVALGARVAYILAKVALGRSVAWGAQGLKESAPMLQKTIRNLLLIGSLVLAFAIILYNGSLAWRGENALAHTWSLIRGISAAAWAALAIALAKLIAAAVGFVIVSRLIRRMLGSLERAINRWDGLKSNDQSLDNLFKGLDRGAVVAAWLLIVSFGCWLFGVADSVLQLSLLALRVYVVILVGMTVVRGSIVIVDTLDGLSRRYAENRGWLKYHDHLRPLLPTFRVCVEYALWILVASLVLVQLAPVRDVAVWGPRLVEAIGIFFFGRVVIELGVLEIGHRMLPPTGLDEITRRRRETMAPLVRTAFGYASYFVIAVLILGSLGFNPMPFLAGAGILGLVVGFGAQSLINDVVSGFFVLLEDTYMIGDTIEAGSAKGVVEGIEFRTTKIRDVDGRLHILRNGDIKEVINYSKDYMVAVVYIDVPYDANLRQVFNTLNTAGEQVCAGNPDVLQRTQIDGITVFGASTMTVRTSTRVLPGRHDTVAAALRLSIKEAFDLQAMRAPRKGLVA